mgnify:CR=1 FL=1
MKLNNMTEKAQELLGHLLIDNPEVEHRIQTGIEENRKGWGTIELFDKEGLPIEAASLTFKQLKHEFHFGCNAFLLDQLPESEKNVRYRELFSDLFNLAVVPFYWSDLEPEEGRPRFSKNSRPIYRRPPPDLVLDFCDEHEITPKGHTLLWYQFRPTWLPHDEASMKSHIRRRFEQISERYADRIPIWDVCNEVQTMRVNQPEFHMPDNHLEFAFELAERYFPNCIRTYNDDNIWYRYSRTYTPVYLLAKQLIENGYKLDALGLQYHMFANTIGLGAQNLNPVNLLNCFDLYEKLNIPINISEISIISSHDLGSGDQFQEILTEKLYRLWFSHKAMNGITWWNLVDNTAAFAPLGDQNAGENQYRAGLVNYDMTPKPAYNTLRRLIKEEWQSHPQMDYVDGAPNQFRGFFGDYELTVKTNTGISSHKISLSRHALNKFKLYV